MDIKKKKQAEPRPNSSKTSKKKIETKSPSVSLELSFGKKAFAVTIGVVWLCVLLVATVSLIYSMVYAHVTFPGAQLSTKDVSNLSRTDLKTTIEKRADQASTTKWKLSYRNNETEVTPSDIGIGFNPSKTTEVIWNYGRTENFFVNLKDQFIGVISGHNFSPVESENADVAQDYIDEKLAQESEAPKNATITYKGSALHIENSNPGRVLDARIALNDVKNEIATNNHGTIRVIGYATTPNVTSTIAQASRQKFVSLTSKPIELSYQTEKWTLDASDIRSWLTPVVAEVQLASHNGSSQSNAAVTLSGEKAALTFTNKAESGLVLTQTAKEINDIITATVNVDEPLNIREYISREFGLDKNILANNPFVLAVAVDKVKLDKTFDPITEAIDIPGKNVRLSFADGKITIIEKSENGRGVDRVDALDKILAAVNEGASHNIDLIVNTIPAKVTESNYESLGIKELLATGDSNFKGSPKNRQHNIHTAASHFEGVLVAPGEEFSFVNYLGEVDASTGYLPELVIKGNKITPEYGGGVCQVSSTLFRAAVYAGLNITERTNHSFVVSYYGTPGMDATIYIPHPDLRFVNNTPGYILMQPRFDGTHLSFDIFGTTDGRKVETQGPYTYDRGPGNSMRTTWTQIVTTASGETKTKVFKSYYKPVTQFEHTN